MTSSAHPMISVVVCVYNEEEVLSDCLQGLARQTYPADRFEILICDDGSTDTTAEIAERFVHELPADAPRTRLLSLSHVGLSAARNTGLVHGSGEIIAYIDGDAIAEPTWIEELARSFGKGADLVGGRINLLNDGSWVARLLQNTRHYQIFGPEVFKEEFIGCNMAYRREALESVAGFQENFHARGDEASLRARLPKRFQYGPAPDAVVRHQRPESLSTALRIEWFSAKNFSIVNRATGRRMGVKGILGWLEKVGIAGLPVFAVASLFGHPLFFWLFALSLAALLRRRYVQRVGRILFGELIRQYGLLRGTLVHFLYYYIPIVMTAVGIPWSHWVHRNTQVIEPMTTSIELVKVVDSREPA